jgi:hypothetical protein
METIRRRQQRVGIYPQQRRPLARLCQMRYHQQRCVYWGWRGAGGNPDHDDAALRAAIDGAAKPNALGLLLMLALTAAGRG